MNAWMFLRELHKICHFQTREGKLTGDASASELKRWLQNGAVIVNGDKIDWNEEMDFPIFSFVLFPKKPVILYRLKDLGNMIFKNSNVQIYENNRGYFYYE